MLERWPRPLLIGGSGEQQLLEAAPVGKPPFSERELQVILARQPQLLPVAHFDPLFAPPVCIGREVSTGAGPLDLLYVSPSGYLTVVETKLWKSSEARRQVVAQIIDYTRRIVRWDFSHLENAFLEYARLYGVTPGEQPPPGTAMLAKNTPRARPRDGLNAPAETREDSQESCADCAA